MIMLDNKKLISIIVIIFVLVLGGASFWHWSQKRADDPETEDSGDVAMETPATAEVKDGLGAEAFNKTKNPLANELPETNPFNVDTNPFK